VWHRLHFQAGEPGGKRKLISFRFLVLAHMERCGARKSARTAWMPPPPSPSAIEDGLDRLPTVVQAHVASFLAIDSQYRLASVARRWRAIVRLPAAAAHEIVVDECRWRGLVERDRVPQPVLRASRPRRVVIVAPRNAEEAVRVRAFRWTELRELRLLVELNVCFSLATVSELYPRLTALAVTLPHDVDPTALARLRALRRVELRLHGGHLGHAERCAAHLSPGVEYLRMIGQNLLGDPVPLVSPAFPRLSALVHLDLSAFSWKTTPRGLSRLCAAHPRLHTLAVAWVRPGKLPVASMAGLRVLKARFYSWHALRTTLRAVPGLHELLLSGSVLNGTRTTHREADPAATPIECGALRVLDLSHTLLYDRDLTFLVEAHCMPRLTALDLSGCDDRRLNVSSYRPLGVFSTLRVLALSHYSSYADYEPDDSPTLEQTLPPLPELRSLSVFAPTRLVDPRAALPPLPPFSALYPKLQYVHAPPAPWEQLISLSTLTALDLGRPRTEPCPDLRPLVDALPHLRWLALSPLSTRHATVAYDGRRREWEVPTATHLAREACLTERSTVLDSPNDRAVRLQLYDGRTLVVQRTERYALTDDEAGKLHAPGVDNCTHGESPAHPLPHQPRHVVRPVVAPLVARLVLLARERGVACEDS
jgi:hypothetical protein